MISSALDALLMELSKSADSETVCIEGPGIGGGAYDISVGEMREILELARWADVWKGDH